MAYDWKIWTGSVKTDAWSWCTPNDKEWYSDAFVFYPGRQCTDVWMLLFFRKKGWKTVQDGVVTGVNHGDTVYARLTDGEQYSEIQNKKIEDTTAPEKANIEINPASVIIGENITAKVTHIDRESGVNISQSKWVLTQSAEEIGTGSDVISQYTGSFTTNSETITLNSGTTGTYYLHVLTTDVAGNKTETVSNAITVKVITGTVSQKGSTTWSNGKASIELETADNQFEIEYKVNEGGWTKYDGAITGLNHGDKITARLTNETTTGPENTFTIEDKKAPVVTVTAGGSTTNSITVRVTAEDKESGMKGNPTYTYQIKQSSQGEEKYQTPSDANNITSNSYTFKNLTQGTSYDVKVEVNGDIAGNTGIGTLANQKTGTVPGGEGGIEQGAITFGTATWQDGKASVTIATNTGLQIQYQKNATETNSWTNIENNGTVANLKHGDTIYARLTDGTNYGEYASINIIDNEVPEKATIELNTTNILIGENITAKVTHKDIKSGVDIGKSGWIMNTSSSAMGTEDTAAYTGKFTTNPETITLNSSAEGTYYLHVLTIDKAGNKTETVSNGITISRITGTVTQEGEITWSGGTATLKLATTESQYKIVYKINGEGSWQEYNGTSITGLNHGDKVKACLTNEGQTTYGSELNITIEDKKTPVVTVTAQGSPTTNSITVTAQASDNETGMKDSLTYTYQIKKSTEPESGYKASSGAENISNAQYTFTGLTQGTNYDIKVEVNGDKAGNKGIGTLTNQTTATVPGADEGLETGSITSSPVTWSSGKASITLTTTTSFKIQYQINETTEGSWSEAAASPVTVSNLDHGNTVYARLTDGTNAGNYAAINILDGDAPEASIEATEVTSDSITVKVTASDGQSGLATSETYKYYLDAESSPRETSTNNTYTYSGLKGETGYTLKVMVTDKAGNGKEVSTTATTELALPEGWDGDKVKPEESSDGKTVPVPIGYTASSASGENSVNDGFVIYEGTEEVNDGNVSTAKTSRNQFVWIPVEDISQIANQTSGTDGNNRQNYQGKLYDFSTSGATEKSSYGQGTESYREPDIVTEYDGDSEYLSILGLSSSSEFKTQLQEEYNEMIESVDRYGGFYIGRYETGNLAANTSTEPVVVKGNNSIGGVNWYYQYQNSKLIGANKNVVSTMIWGSMFDRVLIWLTETGDKTYSDLMNSSSWGNYSDSTGAAETNSGDRQPTGTNEAWQSNNIYDLAGNVWDWTIEAYGTGHRVDRGGDYMGNGSGCTASDRFNIAPSYTYSNSSSRSALYIK
mgnify:CR=1 FL=1